MNLKELKLKLLNISISKDLYSFDKLNTLNVHYLLETNSHWEFYLLTDHGKTLYRYFDSESVACDFFLKFMSKLQVKEYNFWKHLKTLRDGEPFKIKEEDIWKIDWQQIDDFVLVKDPLHDDLRIFDLYKIEIKNDDFEFAAGEFSNNIWGFYVKK
jgi:hypothetical protein